MKRKDAEQSGDGTAGTAEDIVGIAAPPSVLYKKRENAKSRVLRPTADTETFVVGEGEHSALILLFCFKALRGTVTAV